MNIKLYLLSFLNISMFILLVFVYFLAFDLEWGLNNTSLTWGLPLALASTGVIISGITMLKMKNLKYGIIGPGAGIIVMIYMIILLNSYSYVLLPQHAVQENQISEEDDILSLILSSKFKGNEYTVIASDTVMPVTKSYDMSDLRTKLLARGYDAENLTRKLYIINQKPTRLNINSSIDDGYYVDYDNIFSRYITKAGGGWLRWVLFHPQVSGYTHISAPAYDPETGYILIYIHQKFNSLYPYNTSGTEAYGYLNGKLEYIGTAITKMTEASNSSDEHIHASLLSPDE